MSRGRTSDSDVRPLANWDDDTFTDPDLLWWARFDLRYLVEARRLPARRVLLLAFDHHDGDLLVLRQVIRLIGLPRYGPDPADVRAWQRTVLDALG